MTEVLDNIERVEVMRLLPGDLLVVTTRDDMPLSEAMMARITEAFQAKLPAWAKVIVLCGLDVEVVRPDGE